MQTLRTKIDGSVAVIGDVHGQIDKLIALLETVSELPDFENRWIVFIGDFVDRGPDPKGVLDIVNDVRLQHPRTTAIAGNHELAMSAAIGLVPTPDYANWAERWVDHYDAETTFASYGAEFGNLQDLQERMPAAHCEFLSGLPWCVQHPEYLFVHAGLDDNSPFEMQLRILQARDFNLNRPPWLCTKSFVDADVPDDCPVTVVAGHALVPEVQFQDRKILIDTTGGLEGELSCVLLPERQVVSSGDVRCPSTVASSAAPHAQATSHRPDREHSQPQPTRRETRFRSNAQSERSWWRLW